VTSSQQPGAWIHPDITLPAGVRVGFCSCIGHGSIEYGVTTIEDNVHIGAFCVVEHGVHLETDVLVDHYCRISRGTRIGARTRILYRAQVFDNVVIGRDCIIAGELVDRTLVEDEVTFQGNTAHTHADATGDWDETEEPSPTIRRGSVVGIGALLVGGITVGPRSYIAAGELVRCDVPPETVLRAGQLYPLSRFRGMIKVRG
jgi:acetyltransferase-like isoleucine patch superfamily enzyme